MFQTDNVKKKYTKCGLEITYLTHNYNYYFDYDEIYEKVIV